MPVCLKRKIRTQEFVISVPVSYEKFVKMTYKQKMIVQTFIRNVAYSGKNQYITRPPGSARGYIPFQIT